jgi:hypothetical protein
MRKTQMTQLEVLEHQIAELDNDSFIKLRIWFSEFEKTRLNDDYWAKQAELALKTGFVGAEKSLSLLQGRMNAEA